MSAAMPAANPDHLGRVEFVVESARNDARETWLVMRADPDAVPRFAQMGLSVAEGGRVVVEAASLRPIGVLDRGGPAPGRPAGFNPYFDPPIGG